MENIKGLYARFYQDGFLGEDILDLIKILSAVKGNQKFK